MNTFDSNNSNRFESIVQARSANANVQDALKFLQEQSLLIQGHNYQALINAMNSLVPGGSLCILVHAQGNIMSALFGGRGIDNGSVRAESLFEWVERKGRKASLHYQDSASPIERYLDANGALNVSGKKWISYMLKSDEASIPEMEWNRCREILLTQGPQIIFKYGWFKVTHP